MCQSPVTLKSGETAPCRRCLKCLKSKVLEIEGRCLAEAQTAKSVSFLTLTYREGHENAELLSARDMDLFFKLLRRHGFRFRYLCVGEYGSQKGRAHLHALIFWASDPPAFVAGETLYGEVMQGGEPYPVGKNFMERHWPHGWSQWDRFNRASVRYVCKYLVKEVAKEGDVDPPLYLMSSSRRPPLGFTYFEQLAKEYVARGVAPQKPTYWFQTSLDRHGKPIHYWLRGVSRDCFASAFVSEWELKRPGQFLPETQGLRPGDGWHGAVSPVTGRKPDWLHDWVAQRRVGASTLPFRPSGVRRAVLAQPWIPSPHDDGTVSFSEVHNTFVSVPASGEGRLFWSFDASGRRSWEPTLLSEAEAVRRADLAERSGDPEVYRRAKHGHRQ